MQKAGRVVPRAASQGSLSSRMAAWVIAQQAGANTAEVALEFEVTYKQADALLRQRSKGVGDISLGRGRWVARSPEARALLASKRMDAAGSSAGSGTSPAAMHGVASGSGVVAELRQAPDIYAVWHGHSTPGPIRFGSMDFMAIPSRIGDVRQDYHRTHASVPQVEAKPRLGRPPGKRVVQR